MSSKSQFGRAVAEIRGSKQFSSLCGKVIFCQKAGYVLVTAAIKNLPPSESGFFGFHIHEGNNCCGENFSNTGSHYNPNNSEHPRHAGDLPPLMLCKGGAYQVVATDRFTVSEIIGHTVIIHSMQDDLTSQPSGNAGNKIACGVVCRVDL